MKRFDLITEGDARCLEHGETVALAEGGHVTPLAVDTLRERRVTVIREGRVADEDASLVPAAPIRAVAMASDRVGLALRRMLVTFLRGQGLVVREIAADREEPLEYPDAAEAAAALVTGREVDAAIVIDGAGIGSAIAANKINGVRAAMATTEAIARYSREHNGTNLLTLGSSLIDEREARAIVTAWLGASMSEPRYIRRLAKIRALERRQPRP